MANPTVAAALGSAAITGGSGLGASIINYFSTKKNNEQQYEYNKKLAEQAYKQNVEQWMRENAYNTPAMQAARMRAAGINPNVAFGSGVDANSGNAAASPQLGYGQYNPQAPYFDVSSPIQNALSAYMLEAKRQNVEADTELKTGQSKKVLRETENLSIQAEKLQAEIRNLGLSADAQEIANRFIVREKEAKIASLESGTKLNNEQARQVGYITDQILPKEVELKDKQLKDFEEKWNRWHKEIEVWASQIAKTDAEKNLLIMDAENYALNHMSSGFMGTGISFQNAGRFGKAANQRLKRDSKRIGNAMSESAKEAKQSAKNVINKVKARVKQSKFW